MKNPIPSNELEIQKERTKTKQMELEIQKEKTKQKQMELEIERLKPQVRI